MTLDQLISKIKQEHQQVGQAVQKSLDHARKAGEHLVKAKEEVDKSESKWPIWVKNKCGITDRMASNYIRIFKEWSKIEEKVRTENIDLARLPLRAALGLLKKRQRAKKPPLTLPRLATLMDEFGIQGEPEKLLEMLKKAGLKVQVAQAEPQEAAA